MIREIATRLNFPEEAIITFEDAHAKLLSNKEAMKQVSELMDWVFLGENGDYFVNNSTAKEKIEKLAEATGIHLYTINMTFWLMCAKTLKYIYAMKNYSDELYLDSMMDLKYKLDECRKNYGIWGAYTYWFKDFFCLQRFGFGRLEFDISTWADEEYGDFVKKGDLVFGCHIPSGSPLYAEAVLDSFKKLYNHFKDELKDGILVIRCKTWLLYPTVTSFCKETSNMRKFAEMFDIIEVTTSEESPHGDFMWLYGMAYEGPETLKKVPVDTSLRRKMKEHFENGGMLGWGKGVILFDGEKIINK